MVTAAATIAVVSSTASASPPGHNAKEPRPQRSSRAGVNPRPLWSTFPLVGGRVSHEHALENAPRVTHAPQPSRAAQPRQSASHLARTAIIASAAAAALIVFLAARHRRRRRRRVERERRRPIEPTNDPISSASHRSHVAENVERYGVSSSENATSAAEPPGQGWQGNGHLLFVPTGDGYALLERPGAAPSVQRELDGEELGLEGTFRVSRIVTSPLPSDERECAYLERA